MLFRRAWQIHDNCMSPKDIITKARTRQMATISECRYRWLLVPATSQQTSRKHFVFEDSLLSEFLLEVSLVEAAGRKPQCEIDGAKDSHLPSSRLTFRGALCFAAPHAPADANQGRKYSRKVALMGKPGRYCDLGK